MFCVINPQENNTFSFSDTRHLQLTGIIGCNSIACAKMNLNTAIGFYRYLYTNSFYQITGGSKPPVREPVRVISEKNLFPV